MSMLPWIAYAAAAGVAGYTNPMAPDKDAAPEVPITMQAGACSLTPAPAAAYPERHHFRFLMENDSFFNEDNGYTHGTRFDYARDFGEGWAGGFSLTQNIYTPDHKRNGNVPGEHPYAGYLAIGGALMLKTEDMGFAAELQIGTTGKPSFAENAQWFIHEIGNMEQWDGWGDQIRAEPTVQLTLRQDWRLPCMETHFGTKYETDGTLFTREQVGTVAIGGTLGLSLRFGQNLPDSMQVNGNEAANYGIGLLEKPGCRPGELSWFVIAQGQLKYVARDMFIDGGVFHHFDKPCSRKPWIMEAQLGVGVSYQNIDYYLGGVLTTRTYRGESTNPMYGTCAITWHW